MNLLLYIHFSWINCFEVDLAKDWLISASQDWHIKVWNFKTFKCIKTLRNHDDGVKCLKLLPKNLLASGSCDKNILLWNLLEGRCLQVLTGHDGWVRFWLIFLVNTKNFFFYWMYVRFLDYKIQNVMKYKNKFHFHGHLSNYFCKTHALFFQRSFYSDMKNSAYFN